MKSLVIFDSVYANTTRLAEVISAVLAAAGECEAVEVNEASIREMALMDLVVLGGPTHRRHISPAMREFMGWLPQGFLEGVRIAAYDTRYSRPGFFSSSAAREIMRLARRAGGVPAARPMSFLIRSGQGPLLEGQLDDARRWAESLI